MLNKALNHFYDADGNFQPAKFDQYVSQFQTQQSAQQLAIHQLPRKEYTSYLRYLQEEHQGNELEISAHALAAMTGMSNI